MILAVVLFAEQAAGMSIRAEIAEKKEGKAHTQKVDGLGATRVVRQKLGNVVYLSVNDHPAILLRVVLGDLIDAKFFSLRHFILLLLLVLGGGMGGKEGGARKVMRHVSVV